MSNYELISENEALKKRVKELEQQLGDLNKIKAEAVREAIEECRYNGADGQGWENDLEQYANKLENQND